MMNYINAAHVLQHDQLIMLQYMRCIDVVQHVLQWVYRISIILVEQHHVHQHQHADAS
jgi:hypothetical protein